MINPWLNDIPCIDVPRVFFQLRKYGFTHTEVGAVNFFWAWYYDNEAPKKEFSTSRHHFSSIALCSEGVAKNALRKMKQMGLIKLVRRDFGIPVYHWNEGIINGLPKFSQSATYSP